MTVDFTAVFGAEPLISDNKEGLQNPPVYLDFYGPYWSTTAGQADKASLQKEVSSIVSGPYLTGLEQYGSDGTAYFAGATIDSSTPAFASANGPSTAEIQTEVQSVINLPNSPFPRPDATANAPIYVVITDPADSAGNGGFNAPSTYSYQNSSGQTVTDTLHAVWVGTSLSGKTVSQDAFGLAFSHEIVETISDPDGKGIEVNAGPNLPDYLNSLHENQIADYEPEPGGQAHYAYRLNGYEVQPYWSVAAQAFVVPDGNTEAFNLTAQWANLKTTNPTFNSQQYSLTINGDQLGLAHITNDVITIDTTSSGGVKVTLDGQVAEFDPGVITSITVNGGLGADTINVEHTLKSVPLKINLGSNADVVNLSPQARTLNNLQGPITISGGAGLSTLNVDDQATHNVPLHQANTTSYQLNTGDLFRSDLVSTVLPTTSTYYTTNVKFSGISQVVINGAASGANYTIGDNDGTKVQINAGAARDNLEFNDNTAEFNDGANYTIGSSNLTRVGLVVGGGLGSPLIRSLTTSINYSGIDAVTVIGGSSSSVFNVQSTAKGAPLELITGDAENQVVIGNTSGTLDSMLSPVQVVGGVSGQTTLTLDDRGVVNARGLTNSVAYALTSDSVARTDSLFSTETRQSTAAPTAEVDFVDISALVVEGGAAGNVFNVASLPSGASATLDAGAGNDTINLGGAAHTLNSFFDSPLTIHGEGGSNTLNVLDQGTTTAENYTLTANSLTRSNFNTGVQDVTIFYDGMSSVTVDGASGSTNPAEFNVEGAAAGASTQVIANTGYVWFYVYGDDGTLNGFQGNLTLDTDTADTYANINDNANATSQIYQFASNGGGETLQRSSSQGQTNMAPITLIGGGEITFTGAAPGGNQIDIDSTSTANSTAIEAQSADQITFGLPNAAGQRSMQGIAGPVSVYSSAQAAPPTIVLDDSADATGRQVLFGVDSQGSNISGLAPGLIDLALADGGNAELLGGSGQNVFTVQSAPSYQLSLSGGSSGQNSLIYSGYAGAASVNLQTGAATGFASAANVQTVVGATLEDTLLDAARIASLQETAIGVIGPAAPITLTSYGSSMNVIDEGAVDQLFGGRQLW